jgi:hypothetical protein
MTRSVNFAAKQVLAFNPLALWPAIVADNVFFSLCLSVEDKGSGLFDWGGTEKIT